MKIFQGCPQCFCIYASTDYSFSIFKKQTLGKQSNHFIMSASEFLFSLTKCRRMFAVIEIIFKFWKKPNQTLMIHWMKKYVSRKHFEDSSQSKKTTQTSSSVCLSEQTYVSQHLISDSVPCFSPLLLKMSPSEHQSDGLLNQRWVTLMRAEGYLNSDTFNLVLNEVVLDRSSWPWGGQEQALSHHQALRVAVCHYFR